jgi:hypothetical protein
MRFYDRSDKGAISVSVQISEQSSTEIQSIIRQTFGEEIMRLTPKVQTHRDRKTRQVKSKDKAIFINIMGIGHK